MATFSYPFNIAAWTYANPGSLDPDAPTVTRAFDTGFTPAEGVQDEAAHPDGTGRGNLHYFDDGENANSQSLKILLGSTYTDLYFRYYAKFQAGMIFTPGYMKDLDFQFGPGDRVIFGHQDGVWQFINVDNSSLFFGNGTKTWNSLMGGNASDGQWHRFEGHLKAGNGTGIGEIRIDGVDCGSQSGVASDRSGSGWSAVNTFTNQNAISGPGGPYKVYFDEFAVSSVGWIGPLAGGSHPAKLALGF